MKEIAQEQGRLILRMDINQQMADDLEARSAKLGVTLADLMRKALALHEVAQDHIAKGGKLLFQNPDGTTQELEKV